MSERAEVAGCEAEWAFDLDFDTMCTLEAGHDGPHWSLVPGNDDVFAGIEWPARVYTPEELAAETADYDAGVADKALAQLDDPLCDALMAVRIGRYDGLSVEDHLRHLITRVRDAAARVTVREAAPALHNTQEEQ